MKEKELYFPEFLKKVRKEMDISYREMASILGISHSYLAALEYGERKINIDLANLIVETFKLDLEMKEQLYKICEHDNPYIDKEKRISNNRLKLPLFFSNYMKRNKISCRKMADILELSPAYVCELKNGDKKITFKILNIMVNKLKFSEDEIKELYYIYDLDNGLIPSSIVTYLLENKLVEDMLNILENDKKGQSIKNLSSSFKKQ